MIRHILLIKSQYRVKFLNCIRCLARKFGKFRSYILNKKITIQYTSFSFEPIDSISIFIPRVIESQFIKIKNSKNKYTIIGNIYRPNSAPFADIKYFNQALKDILIKIKSEQSLKNAQEIIIVGDMNINLLKHSTHLETGSYLETLLENSLLPLITLPTRIVHNSATILDQLAQTFVMITLIRE